MTLHGLCAPNTTIVDYAYDPTHPLRLGNYPISKHSLVASDLDFYDDPQYESYSSDEINLRAVALFDFTPENDNEVPLKEGQEIWVSYRHGQGWLVAEDPQTGENGLVPEEYVEILMAEEELDDEPQQFLPLILKRLPEEDEEREEENVLDQKKHNDEDDEWEDTEGEEEENTIKKHENGVSKNTQHASLESRLEHLDVK